MCANAEGGGGENRCKSSISLYSRMFILSSVKMILFTLGLLIKNLLSGNILLISHSLRHKTICLNNGTKTTKSITFDKHFAGIKCQQPLSIAGRVSPL